MMACNKLLFLVEERAITICTDTKRNLCALQHQGERGDGLQIFGSNMTIKSWHHKFNSRNEEEEEFQSQTALVHI